MKKSTNLHNLKKGHPFTWGSLIEIHHIGDYHVVEFLEKDNAPGFFPYVNGEHFSRSFPTMDEALSAAIGFKYEGHNSQAAHYFMKMIWRENA